MSLAPITQPHHRLARFAKRAHTDTRPDGTIVVTFAAFIWSKAAPDDEGLSVNWLDHFAGADDAKLAAVRSSMHMTPGAKDRLAIMEVGQLTSHLHAAAGRNITALHDPIAATDRYAFPNPSHAVISGLPDANLHNTLAQEAATFIATDCVIENLPARAASPNAASS